MKVSFGFEGRSCLPCLKDLSGVRSGWAFIQQAPPANSRMLGHLSVMHAARACHVSELLEQDISTFYCRSAVSVGRKLRGGVPVLPS